MSWGDVVSAESKNQVGKFPGLTASSGNRALSKIGTRSTDPCDSLINKQLVVLDMGEASREQGFRLNGCR